MSSNKKKLPGGSVEYGWCGCAMPRALRWRW
jgi:hypothetical protein